MVRLRRLRLLVVNNNLAVKLYVGLKHPHYNPILQRARLPPP